MYEDDLTQIAIIAVIALICGMVMTRLKLPAILGYILAGVVLGLPGLGFAPDRATLSLLAEAGVLMLLFLVGMELSLRGFKRVWRVTMTTGVLQIVAAVAVTVALSRVFGWRTELAILLGFAFALSSTAVAIKILEDIGELRSDVGQLAVGILIAQDLAVVPMLLIVNSMREGAGGPWQAVVTIVVAVGLLGGLIWILSRPRRRHLPFAEWLTEHSELATMGGFALCFGAAAASGLIGLSPAYGAFLAGLAVGNTMERSKMIAATQPIQSLFLMVFFLSIGLLLDLGFIWDNLGTLLLLLAAVTLTKTIVNTAILRVLAEPWPRAFLVGAVTAQIGEFSFVLLAAGVAAGVIGDFGHRLMVSIIVLSLVVSPFWLMTARRLEQVAWRRITSFRQLLGQIYGKETEAAYGASERAVAATVNFTLTLGETGWQELERLLRRKQDAGAAAPDGDPPDRSDTLMGEDGEPGESDEAEAAAAPTGRDA